MNQDKQVRRSLLWFTAVVALGFLFFLIYQIITLEPKSKPTEVLLQGEYTSISQFPKAKEVDHSSLIRLGMVLVQGTFVTDAKFQDISDYYKQELPKHGWEFQGEKGMTTWGKDYGGRELQFSKDDYVLTLEYVGTAPGHNFNFSIALSWR